MYCRALGTTGENEKFLLLRSKTQSLSQLNKHTKTSKQWYYFRAAVEITHSINSDFPLTFCITRGSVMILMKTNKLNKVESWMSRLLLHLVLVGLDCHISHRVSQVYSSAAHTESKRCQSSCHFSERSKSSLPVTLSSVGTTPLFIFSI